MDARVWQAAAPIAIQPIGMVDRPELALLETILQTVYGAPVIRLPQARLPAHARCEERRQWDADVLLDELFARLPERCLRVVGVTAEDLFITGRTFVFGYAHLTDGMAVYSLARLREGYYGRGDDPARLHGRVLRAVVHEMGHTFGAPHCRDHGCVMRPVTQVETLDALRVRYCATCRARVRDGLTVPPWSARGRWERAQAWLRRGEPRRAAALLEHAVRCAPLEPRYLHDLAVARLQAGDRDGAREAFRRAAQLFALAAATAPEARAALGRDDL